MSEPLPPPFEEIAHTADLCLCVYGSDLPQLFVHAAQGMFHLMHCEPLDHTTPVVHQIALDAYDLETLLVDWLGELLYLCETDQVCYTAFQITHLQPTHIEATVGGVSPALAQKGIKAVTFSNLAVRRRSPGGGYETTITFDV